MPEEFESFTPSLEHEDNKNDELSSKDSHYEKEYLELVEKEKGFSNELELLRGQLSGKDMIISKMEKYLLLLPTICPTKISW